MTRVEGRSSWWSFLLLQWLVHRNGLAARRAVVCGIKKQVKKKKRENKSEVSRGNDKRLVVLLVLELAGGSKGDDDDERGKNDRTDNRDDRDGHGVPEARLLARLAVVDVHRLDVLENARAPVDTNHDCEERKEDGCEQKRRTHLSLLELSAAATVRQKKKA